MINEINTAVQRRVQCFEHIGIQFSILGPTVLTSRQRADAWLPDLAMVNRTMLKINSGDAEGAIRTFRRFETIL